MVSRSTYAVPDLGETVTVPPIGPLLTLTSLIAFEIGCEIELMKYSYASRMYVEPASRVLAGIVICFWLRISPLIEGISGVMTHFSLR